MRLLISFALLASFAFAQNLPVAPVPSSPYELVAGPIKLLDESDQRATILGLVERARQNSDLHPPGGHPFTLKATFEASGDVPYTGSGQMEETWYGPGQWQWRARFGSFSQNYINVKGRLYSDSAIPVPLRVQMVRGTIFWPITMGPRAAHRISPGTWQRQPVMCVLGSRMLGQDGNTPTRRWEETEFCMDAKTGLLRTYSIAPGIYAIYDYQNPIRFHSSTLPRTISVYEGDKSVLQVHLESIGDAPPADAKLLEPTPAMTQQPFSSVLAGTYRMPMFGGTAPVATHGFIQPVIVHASVALDGSVTEAESLQTSDPALSAAALALVKNRHVAIPGHGWAGFGEVFVNVRFMPPTTDAGK
jgi:hypothetical protein